MKALVTGASGFVGLHVARAVRRAGLEPRLLLRPTSDRRLLADLEAEVVFGDLTDPYSLRRAVEGCRVVFHVGALYSLAWRDRVAIQRTNVEGTRAVLDAARETGVERVVHTSSVAAVGLRSDGRPSTERDLADPRHLIGAYKRSKWRAEQLALEAYRHGLDVVVVNPSTPVGAADAKPTPTGRIILDFLLGRMPAYVETGLNFVDVEDVAEGHVLALEYGRSGERYILGNENLSLSELFVRLAALSGAKAPRVRLPHWVAIAAAAADELLAAPALGRAPRAPLAGALMARRPMYFDATRAVTELGLPQTPVDHALAKAVDWYRANGYLGPADTAGPKEVWT